VQQYKQSRQQSTRFGKGPDGRQAEQSGGARRRRREQRAEQTSREQTSRADHAEGPDGGAVKRRCRGGRARQAPRQGRTARCRAGSAAGAADRWTRAESAPSGGRGTSAAFSLPLSSPALAVNDSRARFSTRRSYLGARAVDFPRLLLFPWAHGRFPAGPRSFWRPSPTTGIRRPWRGCRRPPDAICA